MFPVNKIYQAMSTVNVLEDFYAGSEDHTHTLHGEKDWAT